MIAQNSGANTEEDSEATLRISVTFDGLNRLFRAVTVEVKPHAAMHEGFTESREDPLVNNEGKVTSNQG